MTTRADAAFARALGFERATHELMARRAEPLAYGMAYFDDDVPKVRFANFLHVQGEHDVSADVLIGDADRLHEAAGQAHRSVAADHQPLWERLTPGFASAGWRFDTLLYMAHHAEPDRLVDTGAVREVSIEDLVACERRFHASEPYGQNPEEIEQLVAAHRRAGEVLGERRFAVTVDGEPGAYAKLRHRSGVAQVEDVVVLEEHRGRGLGRVVVTAALQAALELDPELVFIVADDDGWPRELYAKLGFTPVGRARTFELLPKG